MKAADRTWEQWAVITNDTNQLWSVHGVEEDAKIAAMLLRDARVALVEIREARPPRKAAASRKRRGGGK